MEIIIPSKINLHEKTKCNEIKNKHNEKTLKQLDFFLENEIKITNKIKKINNFSNFYLVINDYQYIDIGSLMFKIDIVRNSYKTANQYVSIERVDNKNLLPLDSYIEMESLPKRRVYNIIFSYHYMLSSIRTLNNKKICYFNLSSQNIFFYKHFPLLSDFSNSFFYKSWNNITALQLIYRIDNLHIQPIEIVLLFYMDKHNLIMFTNNHIDIIIDNYYECLPYNLYIKNDIYESFKTDSKNFLSQCVGLTRQQILHQTINYIDTWDNFVLNNIYITLFYKLIDTYKLSDTIINKLLTHLLKCVVSCPSERKSSHYMMIIMDQLFMENKNWDFVNNIKHP